MDKIHSLALPFLRKTLAVATMTAVLGACSSNDDNKAFLKDLLPTDGGSESFALEKVAATGYTIEIIENCGVNVAESENALVFQNENIDEVTGWSGISDAPPYDGLALDPTSPLYDVPGVIEADSSCNDLMTQTVIVVKKYADWEHQHSNGLEPLLANENKTFADIDSIVLELKLNSDTTVIYSKEELQDIYGDTLTDDQYDLLDQENAVFAISIQNPKADTTKVQAERYIEIDPELYADQWIRVTIPFDSMDLFTGEVWEKNETNLDEQASTVADRLHVVGETLGKITEETSATTYGDVIRNLVGGPTDADWAEMAIPETFKEMSITIKKVEVLWK